MEGLAVSCIYKFISISEVYNGRVSLSGLLRFKILGIFFVSLEFVWTLWIKKKDLFYFFALLCFGYFLLFKEKCTMILFVCFVFFVLFRFYVFFIF